MEKISTHVDQFNRANTDKEKKGIIAQIKKVVNAAQQEQKKKQKEMRNEQ
jgi:hypothetical protein